jgi:hypothetical protein
VKLVDRAEAAAALMELQRAQEAEKSAGANFYEALDRAAGLLKTGEAGEADEV